MSAAALLLVAVGLTDLLRGRADVGTPPSGRRWPAVAAGVAALVVVAALSGRSTPTDWLLVGLGVLVLLGWVLTEDDAREHQRRHGLAVAVLLGGACVLVALSGLTTVADGVLGDWLAGVRLPRLHGTTADHFLLLLGLTLVQLSTGNRLVRLVLASVGALTVPTTPQASDRLRGGRLLGPMERVFILGLGLAGQVTAAGIVVAAKGLIRWPELQATPADQRVGVDEMTEYFLVGSFTSWLLALGSLWLAS